jgi:hypothetical protein
LYDRGLLIWLLALFRNVSVTALAAFRIIAVPVINKHFIPGRRKMILRTYLENYKERGLKIVLLYSYCP